MLRSLILLIIAPLIFSQSGTLIAENRTKIYDDAEAYQVYSAIIPSEWPVRVAKAKRIVLNSSTKNYEMCLGPEEEWQEKIGPAISDYVKLNKEVWLLQEKFEAGIPYELIRAEKIQAIFASGGWDEFYREYPDSGGWIELSAVGFNGDKTIAVVYMGHSCGMLCGGGGFHVLQKVEGKWAELEWKGSRCFWVS